MENANSAPSRPAMLIIGVEEWEDIKETQYAILSLLKRVVQQQYSEVSCQHVTLKEFLVAVKIGRTKFDQLVAQNKIKIVKKRRKIYVPTTEIERFFKDPSIA